MAHSKLTVVVVTYKDPGGLHRTLESLCGLHCTAHGALEVVVVDGGTSPDFASQLHVDFAWVSQVLSEPDEGMYHAMNKGVDLANSPLTWFLNGGDESLVSEWSQLESFLLEDSCLHLFGYLLRIGSIDIGRSPRRSLSIWHGLPTSHQAILYPTVAVREAGYYDSSYAVSADYALTANIFSSGIKIKRHDFPIARFHHGGTSTLLAKRISQDASRVQREILALPLPVRLASRVAHIAARKTRQAFAIARTASRLRRVGDSRRRSRSRP